MKPKQDFNYCSPTQEANRWRCSQVLRVLLVLFLSMAFAGLSGCGTRGSKKQNAPFFTSGSREADQRASQRMAQAQQLGGTGQRAGEENKKLEKPAAGIFGGGGGEKENDKKKLALYSRLGGDTGISLIVDDFLPRAMNDPRVNWERKGVKQGGFSFSHSKSVTWVATPEKVAQLRKHLIQFFALATGGPFRYDGQEMKNVHAKMHISNPEFDAAVGDLKASLDKLQVPDEEQKELLAIVESTRPQIVTER